MASPRRSVAREHRIEMEIVVDAYDAEERALSWYYYVQERMPAAFQAKCISEHAVSPLRRGEHVEVIGMAPVDDCRFALFVRINWSRRRFAVPLAQLEPLNADPDLVEAIEDWHYWVGRNYDF